MVNVGTDAAQRRDAIEVARGHDGVWATAGVHPHDATAGGRGGSSGCWPSPRSWRWASAASTTTTTTRPARPRSAAFAQQIALALDHDLALVIHTPRGVERHVRDPGRRGRARAHGVPLLHRRPRRGASRPRPRHPSVFSGIVIFQTPTTCGRRGRAAPLDRLLVETDAPFLAPVPHRGEENEPALVPVVGAAVAAARGRRARGGRRRHGGGGGIGVRAAGRPLTCANPPHHGWRQVVATRCPLGYGPGHSSTVSTGWRAGAHRSLERRSHIPNHDRPSLFSRRHVTRARASLQRARRRRRAPVARARAEPHDETSWLPLPELENLPPIEDAAHRDRRRRRDPRHPRRAALAGSRRAARRDVVAAAARDRGPAADRGPPHPRRPRPSCRRPGTSPRRRRPRRAPSRTTRRRGCRCPRSRTCPRSPSSSTRTPRRRPCLRPAGRRDAHALRRPAASGARRRGARRRVARRRRVRRPEAPRQRRRPRPAPGRRPPGRRAERRVDRRRVPDDENVKLGPADQVEPKASTALSDGLTVRIVRAFPVNVTIDGNAQVMYTAYSQPKDFLASLKLATTVAMLSGPPKLQAGAHVELEHPPRRHARRRRPGGELQPAGPHRPGAARQLPASCSVPRTSRPRR